MVIHHLAKRFTAAAAAITLLLLSSYLPTSAASASTEGTTRLIVEAADNHNIDNLLSSRLSRHRASISRLSNSAPRTYQAGKTTRHAADQRKFRVIEVPSSQAAAVAADLSRNPAVASVHQENIYQSTAFPNDPLYTQQYALSSSPTADIKAAYAWDKTTGSSNTLIAIIDGGVDLNHEEFSGKIWNNNDPVNGIDDDGNGFIDDTHGWDFVSNAPAGYAHKHATHVAGIAAARGNNSRGIAGVDWGARIMSVRVLNSSGAGREEWIIRGINYAVAEGADIINLSIAGAPSPALSAAIENAYASGVVVVAAAGNSGANTDNYKVFPACADVGGVNMVLGVGATDDDGEPANFSNYGSCVDISAPGKRILSSTPGNNYSKMSGTSMSSPHVAGVAGLYLSLHPNASPAEVINAVRQGDSFTGDKAAEWNARYKGKLNAARVVGAPVVNPPAPAPSGTPTPTPTPTSNTSPTQTLTTPDLTIAASVPGEVELGAVLKYTITAHNNGNGSAPNVTIDHDFDRDLVFQAGSSSSGCTQTDRNTVECSVGNLGANSSATRTITFLVDEQQNRCRSRLSARAKVSMEERGRQHRQDSSDRLRTAVTCN